MSNLDNMKIWYQVDKTDPKYTKKLTFGAGFKPTVVDAQYQIKKMTEVFGAIGIGWGISGQSITTVPFNPPDAPDVNNIKFIYQAHLWIKDGQGFDFSSDINLLEKTKNGYQLVTDPIKKVSTDALTKAFSRLGVAADIFMGQFDDNVYLQERTKEADAEREQNSRREEEHRKLIEDQKKEEADKALKAKRDELSADILKYKENLLKRNANVDEINKAVNALASAGFEKTEINKLEQLKVFLHKMYMTHEANYLSQQVLNHKKKKKEHVEAINLVLTNTFGVAEVPLNISSRNPAAQKSVEELRLMLNKIDEIAVDYGSN